MNINRHNYEEFFLLYADNELSPSEKLQVESFVAENPDLGIEMQMFCEAVLIPEPEMTMRNKASLFRYEDAFINHSNYEEIFILYHDNELTAGERIKTEQFAGNNVHTQTLFNQLKLSRLQPEVISFGDKSSLYRTENAGRIIPMNWWRAAAAVLIIGMAMFGGYTYFNRPATNDIVITKPGEKVPVINDPANITNPYLIKEELADKNIAVNEAKPEQDKIKQVKPEEIIIKNASQELMAGKEKNIEEVNDNDRNDYAHNDSYPTTEKLSGIANTVSEAPAKNYGITSKQDIELNARSSNDVAALQASLTEEEDANKDNYIFYNVSEEKFKKSKVGIFLRKAKRVVTRNTFLSGSKGKVANVDVAPN